MSLESDLPTLPLKLHREEKWPHDLVVEMENPGGQDCHQEFTRMAATLLSIPGAKLQITIPGEGRTEGPEFRAAPQGRQHQFEASVSFDNHGDRGTFAVVQLRGNLVEQQDADVLKSTMQHVKTDGVLFDLSTLKRIGNDGGLGQFMAEWKRVSDEGRTKMVSGPLSQSVHDQLTLTKLITSFHVFDDNAAAIRWFREEGPVKKATQAVLPLDGLRT